MFSFPFEIYIPVWLDQKLITTTSFIFIIMVFTFQYGQIRNLQIKAIVKVLLVYLHSSMVRLETSQRYLVVTHQKLFTFQYGQIRNSIDIQKEKGQKKIYIPVWLDQKQRLIKTIEYYKKGFTFQYGQIRNIYLSSMVGLCSTIYIPVWLDQKL